MLFVPINATNFASPMAINTLHTNAPKINVGENNCQSCVEQMKDMKAGWTSPTGNTAVVNPPNILAVQPMI